MGDMWLLPPRTELELFARAGLEAVDAFDLADGGCCDSCLLLAAELLVWLELALLSKVSVLLVFRWIFVFSGMGGGTSMRFCASDMPRLLTAGGFSLLLLAILALLAAAAAPLPRPPP